MRKLIKIISFLKIIRNMLKPTTICKEKRAAEEYWGSSKTRPANQLLLPNRKGKTAILEENRTAQEIFHLLTTLSRNANKTDMASAIAKICLQTPYSVHFNSICHWLMSLFYDIIMLSPFTKATPLAMIMKGSFLEITGIKKKNIRRFRKKQTFFNKDSIDYLALSCLL